MTIYVPWGLIAIFIAFYFFYSARRRSQLKREERQDRLKERQDQLLQVLREKQRNDENAQVSDTTVDE